MVLESRYLSVARQRRTFVLFPSLVVFSRVPGCVGSFTFCYEDLFDLLFTYLFYEFRYVVSKLVGQRIELMFNIIFRPSYSWAVVLGSRSLSVASSNAETLHHTRYLILP